MKQKLIDLLPGTIFIGFIILYVIVGSLEADRISIGQALTGGGITLMFTAIETVAYNKTWKEDVQDERDRR